MPTSAESAKIRSPTPLNSNAAVPQNRPKRAATSVGVKSTTKPMAKSIATPISGKPIPTAVKPSKANGFVSGVNKQRAPLPLARADSSLVLSAAKLAASESLASKNRSTSSFSFGNIYTGNDTESLSSRASYDNNSYQESSRRYPQSKGLQASSSSSTMPKDMINSVKQSIESKSVGKDPSQKRISSLYEPQEMLKNLRSSISAKTVSGTSVRPMISEKNQAMINGIRDRIDSKRIVTDVSKTSSLSSEDVSHLQGHDLANTHTYQPLNNNDSFSSFGSSFSEVEPSSLSKANGEEDEESIIDNASATVQEHPPVNEEVAKNMNMDSSSESLSNNSNPPQISVQGQMISTDTPIETPKAKPKRRPPPDLVSLQSYSGASFASSTFVDDESTGGPREETSIPMFHDKSVESLPDGYSSTDADITLENDRNSSQSKFPQFPDIKKHKKTEKKGNFLKKYSRPLKCVDNEVNLLDSDEAEEEDETDSSYGKRAPQILTPPTQQVRLKSTMRKTNRRKEKKYMFNENKPWKNHNELSSISEQERKRYEGLWASNKGNYMNSVVTRLVGVDYDSGKSEPEVEEEEDSRKAARLSSKAGTFDSGKMSDQENFHGLLSVEVDQLIHGVVVRRIWKRSRLPRETLEAIWNLVDFRKDGTLNKPEFVVGMWLVDQCLYGRKLPKKVENEVWDSLGSIGLNVVVRKKGKR
ncbi:hypothetical protein G9P44_000683 [Scheffersomyces stipitis]|nr:hypothetical protein G9P44_000683 [Scheffersomyces stipitis]